MLSFESRCFVLVSSVILVLKQCKDFCKAEIYYFTRNTRCHVLNILLNLPLMRKL
jgi:hypothetical protein